MSRTLTFVLFLVLTLVVCGCVMVNSNQPGSALTLSDEPSFDCESPDGMEYVCYSDEECDNYFRGYGAVVVERIYMQRYHGWYPGIDTHVVNINVFSDHNSWTCVGKIEAKPVGENEIYMEMWLNTYDMDCNLLHKGYRAGQLTQKKQPKEKLYEQNSLKLKAIRR